LEDGKRQYSMHSLSGATGPHKQPMHRVVDRFVVATTVTTNRFPGNERQLSLSADDPNLIVPSHLSRAFNSVREE